MKTLHQRIDNRLIIRSNGFIPDPTPLYNNRNGVVIMKNCSCDHSSQTNLNSTMNDAAEYDFDIVKGQTLDFDVVYKDASKCPVNLTGYKARCIAQYNDKTFTINALICDCTGGKIHMGMSAYETSRIFTLDYKYTNKTEYTYQLEIISPSKIVYRIMEGTISVKPAAGC